MGSVHPLPANSPALIGPSSKQNCNTTRGPPCEVSGRNSCFLQGNGGKFCQTLTRTGHLPQHRLVLPASHHHPLPVVATGHNGGRILVGSGGVPSTLGSSELRGTLPEGGVDIARNLTGDIWRYSLHGKLEETYARH